MTKNVYEQWKQTELTATEAAYRNYKASNSRFPSRIKSGMTKSLTPASRLPLTLAAAILILAMGTGIWLKRDTIFGPSHRQIAESYQQTIKALDLYSQTLNKSFDRLKSIQLNIQHDPADRQEP